MKIKITFIKITFIRIISFYFIFLFSNLTYTQENIPFRLTEYNNIIVSALVNNKDSVNLMFQIAMVDASMSPNRLNQAKSIIFKNDIS